MATLDIERKEIKELAILRAKHDHPKPNWIRKVLGYLPKGIKK